MTERDAGSDNRKIGERIATRRLVRGMTQAELADAIGVTKQQISNIELGRSAMSAVMLAKMAKCLSTTTAKLLEGIA